MVPGQGAAVGRMIRVVDDVGRTLDLERPARRVVSLVPSLTETLFALDAGDQVVGVTRYCVEPAGVVEPVAKVGGTKNPDLQAIRALRPDLVVVNAEENRRPDFEALVDSGLRVFVSYPERVVDTISLIERLASLVGAEAKAGALAAELRAALVDAEAASAGLPKRRVFCPIWKNPWMSFNAHTYADDILRLAGGHNICADLSERYPTITLEAVAALQPETVLLPSEPYVFAEKDLPSLAALADTPALRNQRVHFIDGKDLSWYGPRSAAALGTLRALVAA